MPGSRTGVAFDRHHGRRNECALSDGQHVVAGRRAGTTRTMVRASTALGDQTRSIRNRLRSVTRDVLRISYEARSPKTRDALVQSHRKLMVTTRAVLRDADTIPSAGAAAPQGRRADRPVLQRAQDQLSRCGRSSRACSRRAGARAGRGHARGRQSPQRV